MSEPYIKQVRVQDFGCVKDATLELTRLHALIGPNDSGKTTLLRAVRTALQFAGETAEQSPSPRKIRAAETGIHPGGAATVRLSVRGDTEGSEFTYGFRTTGTGEIQETATADTLTATGSRSSWNDNGVLRKEDTKFSSVVALQHIRRPSQWLHLDVDAMRRTSLLFTEGEEIALEPSGGRLPAVYDAILNRGDDTFLRIASELRQLFPAIKSIRLKNISNNTKSFEVELVSGQRVPASFVSDGVLYYLAFAALEHLSPVSVVLIEEPENGLHPARIADVMKVLRRISERVQVILTTHSPFVINELQGDEVTVVTRPDGQGTRVRRLCDTPNFKERSKVYALGELWVSYADGKNEEPLLAEVEGDS